MSTSDTSSGIFVILLILFVVAVILMAPFVFIWAVNTLFSLSIAYSFTNWVASFVLLLFVGKPSINHTSKKD